MPDRASTMEARTRHEHQDFIQCKIQFIMTLILTIVIPTVLQVLDQYRNRYYNKEPYHTSILSGQAWVEELLNGHPERIRTEFGVHRHVFLALRAELRAAGYTDSRNGVTLEEQLGIFLYTCVTGLTVRHVGEHFQRANATIA